MELNPWDIFFLQVVNSFLICLIRTTRPAHLIPLVINITMYQMYNLSEEHTRGGGSTSREVSTLLAKGVCISSLRCAVRFLGSFIKQITVAVYLSSQYLQFTEMIIWRLRGKLNELYLLSTHPLLSYLQTRIKNSTMLWDITPFSTLEVNRRFGRIYYLHLKGRRVSRVWNKRDRK
jgi:hypothetical protein